MKLRTKPNWNEAFISYCTPTLDGQRKSYADIAYEYDVSLRAVERVGTKNMWVERRCEVGISKNAKFLNDQQAISKIVYTEIIKIWVQMIYVANRFLNEELYGERKITISEYARFARAFAIVTDQTLKLFPKPQELQPKPITITQKDIDEFNKFLGITG